MARSELIKTDTGEVFREPSFVKLYPEYLASKTGIKGREYEVLFFFIENMNDKNLVVINPREKSLFLDQHGMTDSVFRNNVSSLAKKNLIKIAKRGLYLVNPKVAAKGDYASITSIEF